MLILGAFVSAVLSAPATAAVSAPPAAVPVAAVAVPESFETGFGGWVPDTDGLAPAWSIKRSTDQAHDGAYSLRFFTDGRQDDGTTWAERKFAVTPGTTVRVTVTFWLWSEHRADFNNWKVVASAGVRDPEIERDFVQIGLTDQVAGWSPYRMTSTVTADASGTIWVAVGTSVLWESVRQYFVDFVGVEILSVGVS
ncbi:hypothetical protein Vau01_046390 [Virgisporangium aurantiacum]|uniref:Uncharacterized protein n=2 Tax=Virgisporangium aurantiacum TaxID=175570 RepID=A0A8J3Z681_9ACTN|nr:hypothetical protein Vau01_046390 [Virgisporangium aurantiacum]